MAYKKNTAALSVFFAMQQAKISGEEVSISGLKDRFGAPILDGSLSGTVARINKESFPLDKFYTRTDEKLGRVLGVFREQN